MEGFRHQLISLKKKWVNFKEKLKVDKLELKNHATEWGLTQVVRRFLELEEYSEIATLAQVPLIVPVTNACLEESASAVKRVNLELYYKLL